MPVTRVSSKRKHPPSFQHYPSNRAKKLKQAWVETAKIKSKWRAEKRKAGFSHLQLTHDAEEDSSERGQKNTTGNSSSPAEALPSRQEQTEQPPTQPKRTSKDHADAQSVRELTRQAYLPSSLHTRKSGHLRPDKGEGRLRVGRKGQPDMKLRMNAMLAKIKQNYT
ncbi:hypothetical protein AX15_005002 [Amanita polypyramis BW_CC]|nr:hypothetical protein AX15_005002 [Amanita polypyramis BW_CC]